MHFGQAPTPVAKLSRGYQRAGRTCSPGRELDAALGIPIGDLANSLPIQMIVTLISHGLPITIAGGRS